MKAAQLRKHRVPLSFFVAVVTVFAYLMVSRAHGVVAGGSMLHAIFAYSLDAGLAASYALRAGLVFILALSTTWLLLAWNFVPRSQQ